MTESVVEEITERFAKAKKPIIIVDACAGRFGMAGEVRKLVEKCQIRFFESKWEPHRLQEESSVLTVYSPESVFLSFVV